MSNPYKMLMVVHPLEPRRRIQIAEHIYIWLLANGFWQRGETYPPPGYEIHHIDCNKRNNDIANLQLVTPSEHKQIHWNLSYGSRVKRQIETSKATWASRTEEDRIKQTEAARIASAEKVRRDGPSPAQLEGLKKARTFAYGGKGVNAKVLTAEEIAEIKAIYPTIKKKHHAVKDLAEKYGIERRRLCRIALS